MINQILAWCSPDAPFRIKDGTRIEISQADVGQLQ
jgi:hypothetical protein